MRWYIALGLMVFIFLGSCRKYKKSSELVQKPRETGIFDEEEIENLPERK